MHAGLMNFLLSHASRALAIAVGWAIMRGVNVSFFLWRCVSQTNTRAQNWFFFFRRGTVQTTHLHWRKKKRNIGTFFWELREARIDHSRRARTDDMCSVGWLTDLNLGVVSSMAPSHQSPAAMFVPTTGGSVQPDIYQRSMQCNEVMADRHRLLFFAFWLATIGLPCMMVSSSWSPNVQIRTVVHGFIISTQNTTNLARTNIAGRIYMQMYREGRLVRGRLLSSRVVSPVSWGWEREPSMTRQKICPVGFKFSWAKSYLGRGAAFSRAD